MVRHCPTLSIKHSSKHHFIKSNKIGSFVEMQIDLETVIENEVNWNEEKKIVYINTHMWNLEKQFR